MEEDEENIQKKIRGHQGKTVGVKEGSSLTPTPVDSQGRYKPVCFSLQKLIWRALEGQGQWNSDWTKKTVFSSKLSLVCHEFSGGI